ncbi:NAD(P)/FAD-dependent oxidoreductase [Marinomonas communis]|uniref:Glycine/D-amino acid oxidase-like deaminating enzyme n=1 Tax=Marinomonas communis TaxID=28254 RepID=A0A4R6X4Y9_9GAMM|nr:FAD-binding oxidoreductase [Marinomonas communis]TDR12480.1 glycine/D-amino acid oxidase-like deaminating enzyme [Marinomonas communis]
MSVNKKYDVVIIGGAVMGSSTAYFLASNPDFNGSVLVIEKDTSYAKSSTALSSSSIRHQFSNEVNIKISQYGTEFIKSFSDYCAVDGDVPELGFQENGYLYLVGENEKPILTENYNTQVRLGSDMALLTPDDIKARFPWLETQGVAVGCLGLKGEGWFDSFGFMQGFKKKARSLGVEYITDEVVDLVRNGDAIESVKLKSGETIDCGYVLNAAGPRANQICEMAGLGIPVVPRKRCIFVFDCREKVADKMPAIIDPTGIFCRPEGQYFLSTLEPNPDPTVDYDDFDVIHSEFEERIWLPLAERVPAFEAIKVVNSWAGHYAFNTLDHNAILGPHTQVKNFLFANGFSGHGLQQAPAVGRGISEIITYGEYRTLDLSPLGYERIEKQIPFLESLVI